MDARLQFLHGLYKVVKAEAETNISSKTVGQAIHDLAIGSLRFLATDCSTVELKSLVAGKQYVSYTRNDAPGPVSRPANISLFNADADVVSRLWGAWWEGKIRPKDLASMSYTIALAPCLAMELFDRQNKKGPATYFECLIGHIFAKSIGTNPHKRATLEVHGRKLRLTMDFLFDMGAKARHIHLPVKMSTRERVVQAWAHQRLLDAAFGKKSYKGIMVLFSETKLDSKKHEVVEICVPDQWIAYQSLLARMDRIYYFDIPARYAQLTRDLPEIIPIKNFGDFFIEKEEVLSL